MLPTWKQYKNWSLPSKWGFVGAILTALSLVIVCVSFFTKLFYTDSKNIETTRTSPNLGIASPETTPKTLADAESKSEVDLNLKAIELDNLSIAPADAESKNQVTDKKLSLEKDDPFEKIRRDYEWLEFYNGKEPRDNYYIFLQKFYGLDGHAALGDSLINSLKGQEVSWSVKVVNIVPTETNLVMVLFEANENICGTDCPEGYHSISWITFQSIEDLPNAIKIGSYIHITGLIKIVPEKGEWKEIPLRTRMHIHYKKITYYTDQ